MESRAVHFRIIWHSVLVSLLPLGEFSKDARWSIRGVILVDPTTDNVLLLAGAEKCGKNFTA